MEKDIGGLVRLGRGAIGRDPREFSEPTAVNKVKDMWPQVWLQVLMQAGLWSFPVITPRKSKPPVPEAWGAAALALPVWEEL